MLGGQKLWRRQDILEEFDGQVLESQITWCRRFEIVTVLWDPMAQDTENAHCRSWRHYTLFAVAEIRWPTSWAACASTTHFKTTRHACNQRLGRRLIASWCSSTVTSSTETRSRIATGQLNAAVCLRATGTRSATAHKTTSSTRWWHRVITRVTRTSRRNSKRCRCRRRATPKFQQQFVNLELGKIE